MRHIGNNPRINRSLGVVVDVGWNGENVYVYWQAVGKKMNHRLSYLEKVNK